MIPVVMSGGAGTRLWPLSRLSFPKQFVDLFDGNLLELTLARLKKLGSPWVVTVESMKVLTNRSFARMALPQSQVVVEPMGRNTAASIALICRVLEIQGRANEVVGIFPADHLIENEANFLAALRLAEQRAELGEVVTIGIKPTYPATGFGYIEVAAGSFASQAFAAKGFREKPSLDVATGFVERGNFFWNAGIFVFRASKMIELLRAHMPKLWTDMSGLKTDLFNAREIFERLPSESIDYGVMEKLPGHTCIPCDCGWSDVGSWDEVARLKPSQKNFDVESSGNFVLGDIAKTYSFVGAHDLVVIDTPDALLISKKGQTQKVKDVLEKVKAEGRRSATEHTFEYRPWGSFEVLRDTDAFKSKVIRVEPGQQLSYQSHAKRAEHWVIVRGTGEVVLNDKIVTVRAGESIFIPQGAKHRMRNNTSKIVEFVEVQVGSYFGEDDITRYSDDYGREAKT